MLKKKSGFTLDLRRRQAKSEGFTLVEILIVMAVVLFLMSFASINLFNLPSSTTIDTTVNTLVEDIKTQQIKAMVGDTEGRGIPDAYGIYFASSSYVMFHGAVYAPNNPDNFVSSLTSGYSAATTLPSSTLVFTEGSGDISNFSDTQNAITIKHTTTGKEKIILLNKHGTIVDIH